jgi:hypothetical protein
MVGRIVMVVTLVAGACSSPAPEPQRPAPRTSIARRELPPELTALVPAHGVYLAGGGEKSAVFRVVVDTDAKTIYTGKAPPGLGDPRQARGRAYARAHAAQRGAPDAAVRECVGRTRPDDAARSRGRL